MNNVRRRFADALVQPVEINAMPAAITAAMTPSCRLKSPHLRADIPIACTLRSYGVTANQPIRVDPYSFIAESVGNNFGVRLRDHSSKVFEPLAAWFSISRFGLAGGFAMPQTGSSNEIGSFAEPAALSNLFKRLAAPIELSKRKRSLPPISIGLLARARASALNSSSLTDDSSASRGR